MEYWVKNKKRLKTIEKLHSASVALDFNIFDVLPEDVMKKMNPDFERPTIGFKMTEKKVEKTSL